MKWTEEKVEKFKGMYMAGATYPQLAFEFGVSEQAAIELRRRAGIPARYVFGKKATPEDLAEVVGRLGIKGACSHYSVSWGTMRRWTVEQNIPVDSTKRYKKAAQKKSLIPEDWSEIAPTMFKRELASHYRISTKTVNKIIEQSGVMSKRIMPKPKPAPKPKKARGWGGWKLPNWRTLAESTPAETHSMATFAARFLRSFYPNVHRCDIQMREGEKTTWGDEHNVPNHGKGWYRVGPRTMTEFEMINHAVERGMDV